MRETTPRQLQVLRFVADTIRKSGHAPQVREICSRFGFASTHAAVTHLSALERKGCLARRPVSPCSGCGRRQGGYLVTDIGRRELGERVARAPVPAVLSGSEVAS